MHVEFGKSDPDTLIEAEKIWGSNSSRRRKEDILKKYKEEKKEEKISIFVLYIVLLWKDLPI